MSSTYRTLTSLARLLVLKKLDEAIKRRAIVILDDATIADMLAKRARDRERDAAEQAAEQPSAAPGADWQEAMKQWEAWEQSEKEK